MDNVRGSETDRKKIALGSNLPLCAFKREFPYYVPPGILQLVTLDYVIIGSFVNIPFETK